MSRLTDWALDLFFPTRCILCRERLAPGRPTICSLCQGTMPSAAGIKTRKKYISDCVSALYYEGTVRDAIRRFKFDGAQAYARAFGELIAERVYEDLEGRFDVITWVPLAPDRRRERGYDQSRLLAEDVSRRLCLPLVQPLKKHRGVSAQSLAGGAEDRRSNIAGAYYIARQKAAAGKRLLLIDDIVTTGSTLSECARMLRIAGAKDVVCATIAMTR